MKITKIDNPRFQYQDISVVDGEYVMKIKTQIVSNRKSTLVTETDDGLDEWLIDVKNEGHNEIFLYEIENLPSFYDPMNFELHKYKKI